jgi:hypothetical protein
MALGALNMLPFRLGGTATNGLTAAQHARIAADWLALRRTAKIASWTYTLAAGVVTLHTYTGQNGAGSAYAWSSVVNGTGDVTWTWSARIFSDPYDNTAPIALRGAKVAAHGTVAVFRNFEITANSIRVRTFNDAGAALDTKVTVAVY